MTRTTVNLLYMAFLVIMTFLIPALLWVGSNGSWEGTIASILSFIVMATYVIYTIRLGARNS